MKKQGQVVFMQGFSDDEFHVVAKNPAIVETLSKIALERYPRYWKLALSCLQAGFSLALQVRELDAAEHRLQADAALAANGQALVEMPRR